MKLIQLSFQFDEDEIDDRSNEEIKNQVLIDEFWTSRQRQSNSIHEISYRACFKAELVEYFVSRFSKKGDYVYDPFGGRGTTAIQAALMGRIPISNDINPLSKIFAEPRVNPPKINEVEKRLNQIFSTFNLEDNLIDNNLNMFYEENTYKEILTLKHYLFSRKQAKQEDKIDKWIRMVATNRLTGHSPGFFSVYTLPPNQATSKERQIRINKSKNQLPQYRDVKYIILKKTQSLLKDIGESEIAILSGVNKKAIFTTQYSQETTRIPSNLVKLVVCSPPFLDIVNYAQDNWLRCWFNGIDVDQLKRKITTPSDLAQWEKFILNTFIELKRILKKGGKVAFEVGEVRKGKIKLDEIVIRLAKQSGLNYVSTFINQQTFTKTSNIWGIKNNTDGTNSNRIVFLEK